MQKRLILHNHILPLLIIPRLGVELALVVLITVYAKLGLGVIAGVRKRKVALLLLLKGVWREIGCGLGLLLEDRGTCA